MRKRKENTLYGEDYYSTSTGWWGTFFDDREAMIDVPIDEDLPNFKLDSTITT